MSQLVTIYGGSGFVGRYIAQRMAHQGWRVRVAVRRPNEALHVKPYGAVGQVEPVLCNVRDDASVRAAAEGADAVVNCVGILLEQGKNKFDAVQHEGAERIARIAAEEGVRQLVHISAIGADADSESDYQQSKAEGEAGVLQHFPSAMILRPSVIFGVEDQFFNRFASMTRFGPVMALVGGDTKFQPVYVDDVARAAVAGITGSAAPGVYELGGPDIMSLREAVQLILKVVLRRRLIVNLPFSIGGVMAFGFDALQWLSGGLISNGVLTRDQLKNLRHDNVVGDGAKGFEALGITPVAAEAILPEYLYRYRPQGQYDAITGSAKNLKT
ncbi:NADH-ubiquinone oxidoreductase [Actibacterium atlanticum]|uniref:NADH-ubiquinone oxidoreductase n=1 Tax=Actibacterium atlanticum TaxID=1461693 RepID=A0A058ZLJ4_9RHOB|nr:complex I NDUFA9 subunit family protein [Actibacterium atlanticum]KCV82423.1 NADH-ubiquinone oxidoreductase [Actibacterium atlanticum]